MLTEAENKEVERNARQYPEIKAEMTSIEEALEKYAQFNAVVPSNPIAIEANIIERINSKKNTISTKGSSYYSSFLVLGVLLTGMLLLGVYFFYQQLQQKQVIEEQKGQIEQLQTAYSELQVNCNQFSQQIAYLRDPSNRSIQLTGTDLSSKSSAVVHWNPKVKKSFLDFVNLPEPPSNKQYQLWAIVDGQPTDMGVFDLKTSNNLLFEVPFIESPQAFAVTLENAGGSATPNLDQLYIIGEVG